MVVVRGRCRRDTIMMSERKEKDFFLFSTAYTNRIDCDSPYNKEWINKSWSKISTKILQ